MKHKIQQRPWIVKVCISSKNKKQFQKTSAISVFSSQTLTEKMMYHRGKQAHIHMLRALNSEFRLQSCCNLFYSVATLLELGLYITLDCNVHEIMHL